MSFNIEDLFGSKLLKEKVEINTSSAFTDCEVIGIYFSAHWCPPCRGFTPKFATSYKALKEAGKKVEVVFASSDQDAEAFKEYYAEMPWLALPYADRAKKEALAKKYSCSGIPHLVFLDAKTGETITTNGRGGVTGKNFVDDFPYHPKPMYDVSECMEGIAEVLSLCVIQNLSDSETQKVNGQWLLDFAENHKGNTDSSVKKIFTCNGGGPVEFIRGEVGLPKVLNKHEHELTKIERGGWGCDGCSRGGNECTERHRCEACDFDYCEKCIVDCAKVVPDDSKVPKMVVLDVPKSSYYEPLDGKTEVTKDNVLAFLDDITNKRVTLKSFTSKSA